MRRNKIITFTAAAILLGGFALIKAQSYAKNEISSDEMQQNKIRKILYFNPDIQPEIEEIKQPTYLAFFSTVTNKLSSSKNNSLLIVDQTLSFDQTDPEIIREYCTNNQADFAVVPKVKYFKVGLGKFVFSSQVIISMKLYSAEGKLISEVQYDTYKKNRKLLGSAENFVKLGTEGALKEILKNIKTFRIG
ncbi:MAG: pyruvate decarboxylase [Bacteroidetes bacterium]|nr:pyruvate decarboxylase [Bacteroidota bacterium]